MVLFCRMHQVGASPSFPGLYLPGGRNHDQNRTDMAVTEGV